MTTKLLSDRIRELHLRPDAPYPSEQLDGRQMIREWRQAQRMRLVKERERKSANDDYMEDDRA